MPVSDFFCPVDMSVLLDISSGAGFDKPATNRDSEAFRSCVDLGEE